MLKSLGTYRMGSGRPESVRFTEISTSKIVRVESSTGSDLNLDSTTTKIKEEPSIDYFNALNLLLDFVIDTGDLGSKWTAGDVEALKISWSWDDRADEWFYSIGVTIKKPIQPDDAIPLILSFAVTKIADEDLPHEMIGYLNTIFDEAWLYLNGKFKDGTQGSLFDAPDTAAAEAVEDNSELAEEIESEREAVLA